jgi:hypothetical protein
VRRATAWNPADRYAAVDEVMSAVEQYRRPGAKAAAAAANVAGAVRRHRWGLLFLVLAVAGAVGAIKYRQYRDSETAKEKTESSRKVADLNDQYNQRLTALTRRMNELLTAISELQQQQQDLVGKRADWTAIARNKEKQARLRLTLKDVKAQIDSNGRPAAASRGPAQVSSTPSMPSQAFMKAEFNAPEELGNAAEQGDGDSQLDDDTIKSVIESHLTGIGSCALAEQSPGTGTSRVELEFVIRNSGIISALKVNERTAGELWKCVWGKMRALRFPRFGATRQQANYWFTVTH